MHKIPSLLHANESVTESIHDEAFEISEMATTPVSRRKLFQYGQEYRQKHIEHIESQHLQTMKLVGQKGSVAAV